MRNKSSAFVMTDPETGNAYTFEARFHDKDIEIDIFRNGQLRANAMIEVYDGKCQAVLADRTRIEETGGDDPQCVVLFDETTR